MENPKDKICRLCLNYEDNNFKKLDASVIGRVKALIPNLVITFKLPLLNFFLNYKEYCVFVYVLVHIITNYIMISLKK